MNKLVLLKYNFLFDPEEAWSHLSQFENDLMDFFAAHELEVDLVDSIRGQGGERLMMLKRMEFISKATNNNQTVRQKQPTTERAGITEIPMRNIGPPPKFTQVQESGVPKEIIDQNKRPNRLTYDVKGRTLRTKIRY